MHFPSFQSKPGSIHFLRLDVRPILARGIEPLGIIRQRMAELGQNQGLIVIAPFLPSPLIELMRGEGFDSKIEPAGGVDWIVSFWRKSPEG